VDIVAQPDRNRCTLERLRSRELVAQPLPHEFTRTPAELDRVGQWAMGTTAIGRCT
jgi:hypothetical protein